MTDGRVKVGQECRVKSLRERTSRRRNKTRVRFSQEIIRRAWATFSWQEQIVFFVESDCVMRHRLAHLGYGCRAGMLRDHTFKRKDIRLEPTAASIRAKTVRRAAQSQRLPQQMRGPASSGRDTHTCRRGIELSRPKVKKRSRALRRGETVPFARLSIVIRSHPVL